MYLFNMCTIINTAIMKNYVWNTNQVCITHAAPGPLQTYISRIASLCLSCFQNDLPLGAAVKLAGTFKIRTGPKNTAMRSLIISGRSKMTWCAHRPSSARSFLLRVAVGGAGDATNWDRVAEKGAPERKIDESWLLENRTDPKYYLEERKYSC